MAGLNSAGFSSRDYRAQDLDIPVTAVLTPEPEQLSIVPPSTDEPDLLEVNCTDLKARFEAATHEAEQSVQDGTMQSDLMLSQALQQNKIYEDEIKPGGQYRFEPGSIGGTRQNESVPNE